MSKSVSTGTPRRLGHARISFATFVLAFFISLLNARAQVQTVLFSVTAPGTRTGPTNWGVNTLSTTDIQRDLLFMGSNTVNFVLVSFQTDTPQTNNSLNAGDVTVVTNNIIAASMVPTTNWVMSFGSGAGVHSWYQSGSGTVYPNLWATNMEVWQRYYHHSMLWTMPFNEPDYGPWGEGSAQNLHDIMVDLLASTNYSGSAMAGPTTLSDDNALSWFDTIFPPATIGTTHCLAGSASSYVTFIESLVAEKAMPINPEAHNLGEAVMGANYGLEGVAWWGPAELARGSFANASKGKQLGYSDNWNNWTSAAVYRGTNGTVQAFLGGSERMATTTSYRLFSSDRDVFYDGHGPQRDYTATVPGGDGYQVDQPDMEQVVNINWGSDVQPAINGQYIIVNERSHMVLDVPGGSTNNGTPLDQTNYTGALYQQWTINPLPNAFGGDVSYVTLQAAHDGVTADDNNFSFNNNNVIQQWNGGTNAVEQWYLQYVTNGYFKIHSRWSTQLLSVYGGSISAGAPIVQDPDVGSPSQLWRLIPAPISAYDFVAPSAPSGLTATANPFSVQLSWNPNSESDLASYTVLRSSTNGGPYYIVARGLTNTVFTDKSANVPQTNYYVVEAMDRSLNTSAYSTQAGAMPTLAQGLVASYSFVSNGVDGSGNGNNVELDGSPIFTPGLSLDGTNQYAMAPAGIMASVTNFTIAAWVYWNGGAQWQRIFDFGNGTTQYMFLTPNSGNGTWRFAVTTNGNGAEQRVETSEAPIGQWFHMAITYNGSTASLYTNGILAASGSMTIPPSAFNPALNNFGASQFSSDPGFNGLLEYVSIYNYALTGPQISSMATPVVPMGLWATAGNGQVSLAWEATPGAASYTLLRSTTNGGPYAPLASGVKATHYTDATATNGTTYYYVVEGVNNAGSGQYSVQAGATPQAGMVGLSHYWRFDEDAGITAYDSVGTNNGTLGTGCSWISTGVSNGGVALDGSSGAYVSFAPGLVSSLTNFTIATWVDIGASNAWQRIFDFGSGTGTYMYLCPEAGAAGPLRFAITTSGSGGEQPINGPATLSSGVWHHVAVTLSNTVGILYLDGIAAGTNSSMTLNPYALGNTTANTIGQSQFSGDPHLTGSVDDFRIYPTALSAAQVGAMAIGTVQLSVSVNNGNLTFNWNVPGLTLEVNTNLSNPNGWTRINDATSSPYMISVPASGSAFYRVSE